MHSRLRPTLAVALAVAVTAATLPPQHAPALSDSKLSIHVNAQSVNATFWAWVAQVRPRVLKLLDPVQGSDVAARAASPTTLLVGRVWTPAQPVDGDPAAAAAAWFNATLPTIRACPGIDVWEGYNEIDVHTVGLMAWYAAMEAERTRLLASVGARAAIGQFSCGVPDVTTPAIIQAFYPAIDAALAAGGVLGLHEYSSPTMTGCFDAGSGEGWLTGRYRKLYREYLLPTNRSLPLVVSEAGIDNSPCGGSPNLGGWQAYCSWWAAQSPPLPGPADCGDQFVFQLAWYDSLLRADAYVVGATLFCYHCDGFPSYEVEPILPALAAYMNSTAPNGTAPT
jgi:hypothetical protein